MLDGRDATRPDFGATGDYGIDAPGVVATLSYVALGAFAVMLVGALVNVVAVMIVGIVLGIPVAITALLMVASSRSGKLRERVRIVRLADLQGDDYVLDFGCGRGLLLVEAARSITDGLAVGVDLWSAQDQSRNEPSAPLDNAVIERVRDVVEVVTGDGHRLPYVDGSFDAVVSSMVLHNFGGAHGPAAAVREIARVLRPGGRLVIVDLQGTRGYVRVLRDLGWAQVARSRRVWRLFPPVRYVTATKPSAPAPSAPAMV